MNYELAKKLHKAGLKEAFFIHSKWVLECPFKKVTPIPTKTNDKYGYRFPLLSELLQACKEKSKDDICLYSINKTWYAGTIGSGYVSYTVVDCSILNNSKGKTPELALARLYLELE